MKYSRASYVTGNPCSTILGCVDTNLIYNYAQRRACHYIFCMSLYILWYSAKSHIFNHSITDEGAKLFQWLSIWTQLFHPKSACTSGSYFHFGTRSKPLQNTLFCFLTWKKTPLLINRHTKLCVKWAWNSKFCPFTSSFMQNQAKSILHPVQIRNILGYHFVVYRHWESIWQAR